MSQTTLMGEIEAGAWDSFLTEITTAVKNRQKAIPVAEGDTVRVTDECRPQYWRGVVATVTRVQTRRRQGGVYETEYAVQPVADNPENMNRLVGSKMAVYQGGELKFRGMRLPRNLIEKV